jgi:hypothetical protein
MTKMLGLGMLFAAVAFGAAQPSDDPKEKKRDPDILFKKLDTNMDGLLSKDEFLRLAEFGRDKDKARDFLAKAYDKVATDKKGLSREQFKKLFLDLGKRKKEAPKGDTKT